MTTNEPPGEVIVVGYQWTDGNASGAARHAFLSQDAAERHLAGLVDGKHVKPGTITVHRLGYARWKRVDVSMPRPLRLDAEEPL